MKQSPHPKLHFDVQSFPATSQLYNKKERERKRGEEGGKKGRKMMVFLEGTKPTLIRPFSAKEFSLFFFFFQILFLV